MKYDVSVEQRIQKARIALLLDHPFFGSLLFRLKGRENRSIATMATDGVSLFYNPEFVATLNTATLAGVLAHEVMHPALHHHVRRSGRNPRRWNEACDYAINPLLLDDGLRLPEGVLVDSRFRGMSAEQIYNLLDTGTEEEASESDGENGRVGTADDEQPDSADKSDEPSAPISDGGIGQVLDAPRSSGNTPGLEQQAREWSIAASQATTLAVQAGKVPSGLARVLEGAAKASIDWREMLRRLWSATMPADYSWMRPNRRHIWAGLYLPGVTREDVGEIAIAIDCSGSVNARQLSLFEAEVRSILEGQRPERVHVLHFDSVVHKVDTYGVGERVDLTPLGGGGTDFGPCFTWLDEHGIVPQTLVFLTDLYGSFRPLHPRIQFSGLRPGAITLPLGKSSRCKPLRPTIRGKFVESSFPACGLPLPEWMCLLRIVTEGDMDRSVRIFTDGSAIGNPGPGGWAAVLVQGREQWQMSGALPWTTIEAMELMAAIKALNSLPTGSIVELRSDSEYLISGMKVFVSRWQNQGWRNRRG